MKNQSPPKKAPKNLTAAPEFPEDFGDGTTLDATAQHLIKLLSSGGNPRKDGLCVFIMFKEFPGVHGFPCFDGFLGFV